MLLSTNDVHHEEHQPPYVFTSKPEPPPKRKRRRVKEGRERPYEDIREKSRFGSIFLAELDRQNMKVQQIADLMRLERDRLIYRLYRPWVFSVFDILRLASLLQLDPVEFVTVWLVSMRKEGDPDVIAPRVIQMLAVDELVEKIPEGERARAFRIIESVLMTLTEDGDGVEVGEVLSRASQKLTNTEG